MTVTLGVILIGFAALIVMLTRFERATSRPRGSDDAGAMPFLYGGDSGGSDCGAGDGGGCGDGGGGGGD